MPFTSSAIYARLYGSWKDRGEEALDLTEFDEHTSVCFLSYVYARDYCPFPAALEPNLELEEQIKKTTLKNSEKSIQNEIQYLLLIQSPLRCLLKKRPPSGGLISPALCIMS
jgi:hypothetical protein